MSRVIIYFACLLLFSSTKGQNLIPNPSFEDTTTSYAQWVSNPPPYTIGNVAYWFSGRQSPDYYHGTSIGNVPTNFWGYQNAHSGVAYAGFGAVIPPPPLFPYISGPELLSCPLLQPLQQAKKYCVTFYVSLADKCKSSVDGMGAYFSTDSVLCIFACQLSDIPTIHISNPIGNILNDTMSWVSISGMYIATGGEKFITIGNLRLSSDLNIVNNSWGIYNPYYFIDDVSVIEMIYDTANTGGDKTICEGDSVMLGAMQCDGCAYQWFPPTGLSDATLAQPTASPTQTTTYILTLTDTTTIDTCVCRSSLTTTDTITVTVISFSPQLANAGEDKTLCKGENVTLGSSPCSNCTYQWQPFNNLSNSTIAQPIATPSQTTTYLLIMTDCVPPCAKTTTDSVNVFVNDCTEPVEVYNIFTPNNDGLNETFYVNNLPTNSRLIVFNRWGSKVYESSNYNNNWDGGKVPDGTYYYLLTLPDKKTFHGFVEIRR